MEPISAGSAVNSWLLVLYPCVAVTAPSASLWLWEVIKDALETEVVSVGDKLVNEDERFFA